MTQASTPPSSTTNSHRALGTGSGSVLRDGLDARLPQSLVDLHIHVGGAVAPHILYSIAMDQGFKLPTKGYWEFVELVTIRPGTTHSLDDYLKVMHEWTERIQSSPAAMERAVYEIIGKEYRSSRVDHIELRFNPMKRNQHGQRDLDHIIHAAIRGMGRSSPSRRCWGC